MAAIRTALAAAAVGEERTAAAGGAAAVVVATGAVVEEGAAAEGRTRAREGIRTRPANEGPTARRRCRGPRPDSLLRYDASRPRAFARLLSCRHVGIGLRPTARPETDASVVPVASTMRTPFPAHLPPIPWPSSESFLFQAIACTSRRRTHREEREPRSGDVSSAGRWRGERRQGPFPTSQDRRGGCS